MAKLIYDAFTSLDGYVADENGNFNWAELDAEVFAFINDRERQIGTYLFGRKMYEMMAVWETPEVIPNLPAVALEFVPIWQAGEVNERGWHERPGVAVALGRTKAAGRRFYRSGADVTS